jgi:protein-S-isoprenylcysteine O-methyltransferase Ste14
MKATPLEYRFRYLIHALIFLLGFVAPWNYWLHLDPPGTHVWGDLALELGMAHVALVSNALLLIAIVCALTGAWLRTWGAAYLGADVVKDGGMHTATAPSGIIEAGPFRYLRNPLYLGTFLHTIALSLLMTRTGAIFTIVAIGVFQIRLILAEEPFLSAKLGAPYAAYCKLVPRILPSLRPRIARAALKPRWPQAFLGEIYMWGVALSFALAGWKYNAFLLTQCVLVAFGVSILTRAITGKKA